MELYYFTAFAKKTGQPDRAGLRPIGNSMIRGAHDYQRVMMDFGGSVAFVSDQGGSVAVPPDHVTAPARGPA